MKARKFAIFVIASLIALFTFGIRISAAQTSRGYIVSQSGGEYFLYAVEDGTPEVIRESENIDALLSGIFGADITFNSVSLSQQLTLCPGEYKFSGSLTLCEGGVITVSEGAELTLSDININIPEDSSGYIRIKGGTLISSEGAVINSAYTTPIILDFSSSSSLLLLSGSISTASNYCIDARLGSVNILGASITSAASSAIKNSATLSLGASAEIFGAEADIESTVPIRMSCGESAYRSELSVKFLSKFERGGMYEVLYHTDRESSARVKIYDKDGTLYEHSYFDSSVFSDEKSFCAVYLPYRVSYYDKNEKIAEIDLLSGMCAREIEYSMPLGYNFSGWYSDEKMTKPYDFTSQVYDDTSIYLKKSLAKPNFSLSSMSFTYDKAARKLGFDELSHPFSELGIFSYEWYKNDVFISSAKELSIVNVNQSGSYFCKVKFSYNGDFVEITTPSVAVNVKKCIVELPTVSPKKYTGYTLYPDVSSSEYYTFEIGGGINVGNYTSTLTLKDSENYTWRDTDSAECELVFSVTRAENSWQGEPSILDFFVGAEPNISATALFGEAEYLFSSEMHGDFIAQIPKKAGDYYLVCTVAGTDNYEGLRSAAIPFKIIAETALGMYIERMPDKTQYVAFEAFLGVGISVVVDYNSGRTERIGIEDLSVKYSCGDSLRFGDGAVILSYGELSVSVPVNVERAEYDISGITLPSLSLTFDGSYKSIKYTGALPVGKDGIPLSATVAGGGSTVGEYNVSLVFSTDSENYKTPSPLSATLKILPMSVEVIVNKTDFVYNSLPQAPEAYFLNENMHRIPVTVIGAKIKAGEGYTATLVSPSANYVLDISEVSFRIEKADYDMSEVRLDRTSYIYDAEEKKVTLSGLPAGVSVIGYADNFATNAGNYTAVAIYSYDNENYNPPSKTEFSWCIEPAEYDMSGIVFLDKTAVFDTQAHYPEVFGKMPIGKDGISPAFFFSIGVSEVTDEPVSVEIVFYTESENYKIPDSIVRTVKLTPMPISVVWNDTVFTYNGTEQLPSALSDYTAITVFGGGTNAGRYVATAKSNSRNYEVINSECEYIIKKAENYWTVPLQISNIYASGILRAYAEAFCGEVEIKYFSDEQLLCEIEKPTSHGVYYAAAYSAESENYLSLVGSGVRFEIWEVLPCGIETMLIERIFYAYERLLAEDFLISVMYNDGTAAELDSSFATVIYENGDSLRRRDTGVKISYLGFEDTCDIEVSLANYDMSGAVWENRVVEYSGREQKITLSGLPLGISVRELVGGVGTAAGEYAVTAYFDYDTENYNPPPALSAVFVIEKKKLSLPEFPPKVYSGELILPSIDENLTLSYEAEPINAGIYMLSVSVCDTLNCVFENGESVVKIPFEIKRATLTLNVENVKLHLFEGLKSPEYSVSGIMGDERVDFEFSEKDGKIYAVASNPNYEIHIVGGEIERVGYPSREYMKNIFICILLFAIIALLFFIAVRYKYPILEYIDKGKAVFFRFEKNPRPTKEDKSFSSPPLLLLPDGGGYSSIMSVDMPKADSLISDTMAKNLIKRSSCGIKTAGYKKAIVNIGVISANFSSEDTVDINKLKEKKLIPEDAGYVKVLADGIVDKPLFVYANAFSLSAVKMIALTGGEAVKVTSAKMWHRKERI